MSKELASQSGYKPDHETFPLSDVGLLARPGSRGLRSPVQVPALSQGGQGRRRGEPVQRLARVRFILEIYRF